MWFGGAFLSGIERSDRQAKRTPKGPPEVSDVQSKGPRVRSNVSELGCAARGAGCVITGRGQLCFGALSGCRRWSRVLTSGFSRHADAFITHRVCFVAGRLACSTQNRRSARRARRARRVAIASACYAGRLRRCIQPCRISHDAITLRFCLDAITRRFCLDASRQSL